MHDKEIEILKKLDETKQSKSSLNRQIGEGNSNQSAYYHTDYKENNLKERGLVRETLGQITKEDGRKQQVPMLELTEKGEKCKENPDEPFCSLGEG